MFAKFIVKAAVVEPITVGSFETTRILYPVPVGVFAGIVAVIVPEGSTPDAPKVPIVVPGKTPEAFDNCAVKVLLALKVPTLVKGTETDAPVEALTQNGLPEIADVVIVFDEKGLIFISSIYTVAAVL